MMSMAYEKLTEIKDELSHYQSPVDHKCCEELGSLDKSIAWRAASHLSEILRTKKLFVIETRVPLIHEFIATIAPCSTQFSRLYSLLNEANYWLRHLHREIIQDSVIKNTGGSQ